MARHQAREAGTWTWTVTSPSSPGNVPQLPKWHRVLASCNCQKVTSKNGGTILPDMYLEGTSEETHHVARWICFVRGAKKMQSTFTNSSIANSGSSKTPQAALLASLSSMTRPASRCLRTAQQHGSVWKGPKSRHDLKEENDDNPHDTFHSSWVCVSLSLCGA